MRMGSDWSTPESIFKGKKNTVTVSKQINIARLESGSSPMILLFIKNIGAEDIRERGLEQ